MADTVQSPTEKLKVFISYARADGAALAEELVTGLDLAGFEPFLDRHDIAAAEDWEARLGALIQSADTIVFIISPAAVKGERCAWEVEHAHKLGKRLIAIQLVSIQGQRVPESDVPDRLRCLNYIFFNEGQSSLNALSELARALRQDVEWIREHTRLNWIALRWDARRGAVGEADDLLLRGYDLTEARAWIARRKEDAPEITALQRSYLAASESSSALAEAERRRLDERERLIAELERAQRRPSAWLAGAKAWVAGRKDSPRQVAPRPESFPAVIEKEGPTLEGVRRKESTELGAPGSAPPKRQRSNTRRVHPGTVFISYRREDSSGYARGIYDRLVRRLGRANVFFDVDNIPVGVDFVDLLTEKVGRCDTLIAVIGTDWISSSDRSRRRIDNPLDFVRIEIESALKRGIPVIPVLVDGAVMPSSEELPDALSNLARRQGIEISHTRFDFDVKRLVRALAQSASTESKGRKA
jgi:TIR domain